MEKRSGWLVKFCFVGARKCGVILKAACKAGLRDWHSIQDQSAGKQKPAVGDIISDGISGFRFEKAHHIIFAQINPGREKIYVQSLRQMLVVLFSSSFVRLENNSIRTSLTSLEV